MTLSEGVCYVSDNGQKHVHKTLTVDYHAGQHVCMGDRGKRSHLTRHHRLIHRHVPIHDDWPCSCRLFLAVESWADRLPPAVYLSFRLKSAHADKFTLDHTPVRMPQICTLDSSDPAGR